MKKFLSILLVVVLCLTGLIACGNNNGEDTAALDDAAAYLYAMYKDKATNTPNDYDVVAKVVVNGKSYSVTWTTSDERVTVKEKSASFWTIDVPDVVTEEISYTLTATIKDANGNTAQKSFNRVVPVIDKGGITNDPEEGVAYKLYMNQAKLQQKFYALTKTQNNENKFIETTNNPKEAPDFFIEKVDGGVKIYTMIEGVKTYVYAKTTTSTDGKVSKYIGYSAENSSVFFYVSTTNSWQTTIDGATYVFGTYDTYKTFCISEIKHITAENTGVSQFVMEFMTKAHAESLAPDEEVKVEVPAANSTLTITEANELGLKVIGYTEGKYYVTGIVDEIANSTYGNIYIKDAAGNRLYVYGIYDADGTNRFDAMTTETQPKVGDTITVYGIIGNYNGAAQMKNGWVTAMNSEGGSTPVEPDAPASDALTAVEAGVAYKFGMIQGNVSTTTVYYLAGGMSSFYMATTDNAANAIDVYLEATEGGYYLYTMVDGAKTYINMVVSADGAHVNGAYEATASTIYTFDAEKGTIVSTVNEELYWFGTRNDKTYTTVGPCAVSYAGFYCQFYATDAGENEGGSSTPETPDEPETPVEPEEPTNNTLTIPEANELGLEKGNNNYTTDKYYVTGVISEVRDTMYGNIYITDENGNKFYIYGLYTADGSTRYDAMTTKPVVGDTITVYGVIGAYSNAAQMKNGWMTEYTAHEHNFSEATCSDASVCSICGTVNAPALGHNYENGTCTVCGGVESTTPVVKYVLKATAADGTAYYWTGVANGGKGVITTDASAAAQFIMEEAEGGVYIYFVDNAGVKQYITIGTANTGLGTSAVATVLNYDAENGYVYANDRYISTYKTQDIRTYLASNIPGSSNNMYMVMTVVE